MRGERRFADKDMRQARTRLAPGRALREHAPHACDRRGSMMTIRHASGLAAALLALALASPAVAKDKVKVAFIGPITGGVAANGLGGRNSADLAVKLRNADPKAKYEYDLTVLDDECKPNTAVQAATKAGADD